MGVYAARFGAGLRSVKRWVAVGRAKNDPPPLDRPEQMPAWWSRHYKQQVPDKILAAAVGKAARASRGPEATVPRVVPPRPAGIGLERDELAEAQEAVDKAANQVAALNVDPAANLGEIALATKVHAQALANRKTIEATIHERKVRDATFIERSRANQIGGEWVAAIERAIRGLHHEYCAAAKIEHTPETEEQWQAVVDRAFERFGAEIFPAS